MKLKVRIELSPRPVIGRPRLLVSLITKGCFRISAPKAENGFVGEENCFVAAAATKHGDEKPNDFSERGL